MNSPKWMVHWPQRRPTATIYQLTDRLHRGHVARVPAHQITATVSAWLADLGADSPLVDELELGECLSIEIAVAD